jgi:hypothetical protein
MPHSASRNDPELFPMQMDYRNVFLKNHPLAGRQYLLIYQSISDSYTFTISKIFGPVRSLRYALHTHECGQVFEVKLDVLTSTRYRSRAIKIFFAGFLRLKPKQFSVVSVPAACNIWVWHIPASWGNDGDNFPADPSLP